ncbi:uncharacterized protein LOC105829131, partial [Monomorium pharaonis]|uniref:uncharacterized protein LOC105829131 n=1 Tax=Monomorium pharaonis TaxID=307658 RepID=UPI001747C93C
FTPVRSIYIRNCSHHNRGGRPNEIELRIVSTDVSSTAGTEDRVTTRVTVSACESSSSRLGEFSRTADVARPSPRSRKCLCPSRPSTANRCAARPPFRRRVSFSDATSVIDVGDDDHCCRSTMQDDDDLASDRETESKTERETFYDIWQAADDSLAGRSDDGYSDSTPRIVDNYAENRSCGVSGCALDSNKGRQSESIGEKRAVESDDACPTDRIAGGNKARSNEDDTAWNEDLSSSTRKNVDSIGRDEYRMRGGCGGCCGGPARENFWRSSQDYGCRCRGLAPEPSELCAPSTDRTKTVCVTSFSRSCCRCARICKKAARCEPPSYMTGVRSCDGGGCCGGGCCCGKSDKICASSPKIYNSPAHFSRRRSPCAPRCSSQSPCSLGACRNCCSRSNNCRRSRSPRCLSVVGSGCCGVNDSTKCGSDGVCCRLRLPCECLGGGLDCRRCGRKVYQAEMQIASGAQYHNICFSCFCCRKPLEPLTYQENGGEIYCKQCYVRNFGPQGYGYGVGGGVLQTPL